MLIYDSIFLQFLIFFPLSLLYICWHIMNFYASYLYIHLCFAYNSMGFFLMENKEQKGKKLWNMATNKRIGKKLFHWHYEKKLLYCVVENCAVDFYWIWCHIVWYMWKSINESWNFLRIIEITIAQQDFHSSWFQSISLIRSPFVSFEKLKFSKNWNLKSIVL